MQHFAFLYIVLTKASSQAKPRRKFLLLPLQCTGSAHTRAGPDQHCQTPADASASLPSNDPEAHVPSANDHGTAPGHAGGAGACCCQKAFRDWVEEYAGVLEAAAKHIYDLEAQLECMRMEIRRVYGGGKHMSEAPFPQVLPRSGPADRARALPLWRTRPTNEVVGFSVTWHVD